MISTLSCGAKINLSARTVHNTERQSKKWIAPFSHCIIMLDGYFFQLLSGFSLGLQSVTNQYESPRRWVHELTSSRSSFLLRVPVFLFCRVGINGSYYEEWVWGTRWRNSLNLYRFDPCRKFLYCMSDVMRSLSEIVVLTYVTSPLLSGPHLHWLLVFLRVQSPGPISTDQADHCTVLVTSRWTSHKSTHWFCTVILYHGWPILRNDTTSETAEQ